MRPSKLITSIFIFTLLAFSLTNFGFVFAGYETDPAGDADGVDFCDITRIDVDVTYNHPSDDDIILKITLAEQLNFNENTSGLFYAYNFYVDTSLSTNSNTSLLDSDDYEYIAHYDLAWSSGLQQWNNHSYLMATRYYYTGDGQGKTLGTFWWNPNTDSWQGSDPQLDIAVVSGNTISWDVTGAIYRQDPIGGGYLIQGVASTSYNLNVKDYCTETGWVGEFTNMCVYPSNTSSPSFSLPSIGIFITLGFLAFVALGASFIRRRK